jgi:sodium pump decarboxylase gamma subunit
MDYTEGLKALICGLTTVFLVLITISLVISLFKYIKPKKKEVKAKAVVAPVVEKPIVIKKQEDDLELIAVITAAIAASLNTTTDRLMVTSFRKIKSSRG